MAGKTPIIPEDEAYPPVQVSMLGGFRLQANGHEVDESLNRARQLWNLLEYLIAFRHRDISPTSWSMFSGIMTKSTIPPAL